MIKSKYIITSILCLCFCFKIAAQTPQPITLASVLELSAANDLTIKAYQLHQELALAKVVKSKEWWLPEISVGVQTHQLWGAAMNGNGNFFIDVSRNNLWAGLGLDANWNFAEGIYTKKAAELKAQATQYDTKAARNQAILTNIETYYDFVTAQLSYQAYQQLVEQADTIVRQIEIQVRAGLRYQSEALLSKSNLNHLKVQMLHAKADYGKQSANLVGLLNLDPKTKLVCVDTVIAPLELINVLTSDFNAVYEKRPELKSLELSAQAMETEQLILTKGLLFPELQLNTYGAYFGSLNGDITPMVATTDIRQLYPTTNLNLSLMWKIPLGQLVHGGDLEIAKVEMLLQKNEVEQVKANINKEILAAQSALMIAKEQMDIASEGSQLAQMALEQSIQRQALGTIRPFEILQSQEIFIKSQLDYLNAVSAFNKSQYQLFVGKGNAL